MKRLLISQLKSLTDFAGRETRSRFWRWAAVVFIAAAVSHLAIMLLSGAASDPRSPSAAATEWWSLTTVCVTAVGLLAASVARRLHDRGWRGFWALVPLPFLAVCLYVMKPESTETLAEGLDGVLPILTLYDVSLIFLIVLLAAPSNAGANRFGPVPA